MKLQYGLTNPDITAAFNVRGQGEKYFLSTNGSNAAGSGYYVLMPVTGDLYAYVQDPHDNLLTDTLAGTPVAALGAGVYANTALLYNAKLAPIPVVPSNQGPVYDVREQYGLSTPDIAAAYNFRGADEKYFQSNNGSNSANGGYYVLMPDRHALCLCADGDNDLPRPRQAPVADLSGEGVYANTALLYDAQPLVTNDPIYAAKEQFGLNTADITAAFNYPRPRREVLQEQQRQQCGQRRLLRADARHRRPVCLCARPARQLAHRYSGQGRR